MNVFIIAALTLDGFIAKDSDHLASWTSKADKKRFVELTNRAGVMVMGRKTFETIGRALKNRKTIVYSKKDALFPGTETSSLPPVELIKKLEAEGYKEVAICGGSQIYTLFMQSGVVTHLYLTVEPVLFGTGITLFNESLDAHLKLVSVEKTEHNTLLLDYIVESNGGNH